EAPFYEEVSHSLRFVDIDKKKLHAIDLNQGPSSLQTLDLDVAVSITADIEGSEKDIIVGAKHGYALLNRNTGQIMTLKKIWDERDGPGKEERMRLNDGAVDSSGRFWVGAMNDPTVKKPTDEGVLFRLDPDRNLHRVIENVTVPNGIGWGVDNKTMYFTDSPTKNIAKFKYDSVTGDISDRKIFFHWDGEGVPDGFVIDVEGCLWVAIYGGSKVIRIAPEGDDGKVIGEISLPTRFVTCPTFVGGELFISSAEEEEPDRYPQSTEFAGNLFRVHVGVRGLRRHKYRCTTELAK
ncbi:hypothetical protein MMC07_002949, partial [Pseudocyphellaria aurata]|nr:hypothetical protein [Pseudocyphellaria aurata]